MKMSSITRKWLSVGLSAAVLTACGGGGDSTSAPAPAPARTPAPAPFFVANSVVSDFSASTNPYNSPNVDIHLISAWGIAFNPVGYVWVANAGTSTSTLYNGNGIAQSLVVAIPAGTAGSAKPTGIVNNGTTDFVGTQAGYAASPSATVSTASLRTPWFFAGGPSGETHGVYGRIDLH